MKYIFNIGILLCLFSAPTFGESISTKFLSPDKSCHIVYKGAPDHGNGAFYDSSSSKKKLILKEYVRIEPQINWKSDSLAEIFFSEGAPAYHSYFYDCKEHIISPSYSLIIAFEPKTKLIATLQQGEIVFYKLFEKKEYFRAQAPEVGLTEYFDCDSEASFEETNIFHIKVKCESDSNVDLKIEVPK
jgi:hypothetical protein